MMTPPSAVPSVIPQTGKPQLLRSLQIWIKSQTGPTRGTCLSIRTNLTLSLCLSERTIWKTPQSTFSTILCKKSFNSSFWVSLSAMIFSGNPHFQPRLQSQLPTGNPPSCKVLPQPTYKVFFCSRMEYCSPLLTGAPASHLSRLHAVETKAFSIIGIDRDEAESLASHTLTAGRSVVFLSSTVSSLVSPTAPTYFHRALKVYQQPPSGKTMKIANHCSSFSRLWNKLRLSSIPSG